MNPLRKHEPKSRDLLEIAARAKEQADQERRTRFRTAFEEVFGYRPLLGEPEVVGYRHQYWVQGFLFSVEFVGESKLYVKSESDTWVGVSSALTFHTYFEYGRIRQREPEEYMYD